MTHVAAIADVLTHTDFANPIDAKTLREITTKYDERGRKIAETVWLAARGTVDPDNPPIAGDGGIPASAGLTTRWQYDDDLADAAGIDASFSTHLTGIGSGDRQ